MAGNSIGQIFKLITFGESHGKAIGGMVDGCPAGLSLDEALIQEQLDRRRPGQSSITSPRKEADRVEILSGIFEGKTLGTPIGFIIKNEDQKSEDYDAFKGKFRASHADLTYELKYAFRDHRGGGRASARETACRVVGGSIANQLLAASGLEIIAWVSQIGQISMPLDAIPSNRKRIDQNAVRCPDPLIAETMKQAIEHAAETGDSLGGIISCLVKNCPSALGEPVFDKLEADLAKAMLSINASKGFELGSGFRAAAMRGSEYRDHFIANSELIKTTSNHDGGINGGISNGMDIFFRVAFKPVSTSSSNQELIDRSGKITLIEKGGRHDPCVVPRAVPIVESMTALVLADHWLRNRSATV